MQSIAAPVPSRRFDMKPELVVGRHVVASAEVTRLGGRVGPAQMRLVKEDGVLIATGAASCILA